MYDEILYTVSVWLLPVLIAITLHEAAHGYVAWKLGDNTAKSLGRVSFDPLKHVDLWGTIIIPALLLISRAPFLFGWAKPVPVDFSRLENPKRDMMLVAAAGPGINLCLAVAASLLLHAAILAPDPVDEWLYKNLQNAILINLVLAVFNMLPIPPLDGGRVAVGLLPVRLALPLAQLERFGLGIVIFIILIVPWLAQKSGIGFDPLTWLVLKPVWFLADVIGFLTGH